MVSPLISTTRYILQPVLLQKHQETKEWMSALELSNDELMIFEKILMEHSRDHQHLNFKMQLDHFQHLFNYYRFEVIITLKEKLTDHQSNLARMLKHQRESDLIYFKEHQAVIDSTKAFQKSMDELKVSFSQFIQGLESPYSLQN